MESANKDERAPSFFRFIFSATGVRIALALVDTVTDIYAAYKCSIMEGQWRNVAFYGLLASLIFHNVISAMHGTHGLFHAHQVKPLKMLDKAWWRYLVIAAHLVGLGNIMIPLTLIFSSNDMTEVQFKER